MAEGKYDSIRIEKRKILFLDKTYKKYEEKWCKLYNN